MVTVEFTPPGQDEAVRFQTNCGESEVSRLGLYQQVPIHYREQNAFEAVIDELVK